MSPRTLSDVHPAIVYRMLSTWTIFKDPLVFSALHATLPAHHCVEWPKDPLPPGMLILLMDSNTDVRRWAEAHAAKSTVVPISIDHFIGRYPETVEIICRQLTDASLNAALPFSFASNDVDLWSGFRAVLRQIPIHILGSKSRQYSDFRGVITRHLFDTGPRQLLRFFLGFSFNTFPRYPTLVRI